MPCVANLLHNHDEGNLLKNEIHRDTSIRNIRLGYSGCKTTRPVISCTRSSSLLKYWIYIDRLSGRQYNTPRKRLLEFHIQRVSDFTSQLLQQKEINLERS